MLRRMLRALGRAGVANDGTSLTHERSKAATTRHPGRGQKAKLGAIAVQTDAVDHFANVGFLRAGTDAVLARCSTGSARLNTFWKLFM
jgi:hypothetical protein